MFFFFSSRRRHTIFDCDWSSDVCSSDLSRLSRSTRRRVKKAAWPSRTSMALLSVALARRLRKDRKSTRLNSSHSQISYAVFCLKKKKKHKQETTHEQSKPTVRPKTYVTV